MSQPANNPTGVQFVCTEDDCKELCLGLDAGGMSYQVADGPAADDFLGFDVEAIRTLIVAIKEPSMFGALATAVVAYLKHRKKQLVLRRANGHFRFVNYDKKDIIEILMALEQDKEQDQLWIAPHMRE